VPGVTAVGIAPLLHESALVVTGAPDPRLKGDLLFMARQMKLQCPPLPFAGQQEYKVFNEFMLKHPKPTSKDVSSFCKVVLGKVDCKTFFPKTVPLFKAQYIKWKEGNLIRAVDHSIKSEFDPFLQSLARPVAASSTRASSTMVQEVMPLHDPDRAVLNDDCPPPAGLQAPTLAVAEPGFVPTMVSCSTAVQKKCFYWPCCKCCANICGGHHQNECGRVRSGEVKLPGNFTEIKAAAKKEEKRLYVEKRRATGKSDGQKAKRKKTSATT
jgi:hypothetical protein